MMRYPKNETRYRKFHEAIEQKLLNGEISNKQPDCIKQLFTLFREYNERFFGFAENEKIAYQSLLQGDLYAVVEVVTDKLDEMLNQSAFDQELRYKWSCLKSELDDLPDLRHSEIDTKQSKVFTLIDEILIHLSRTDTSQL